MTDENLLEEKCSCVASIKVVLPGAIGCSGERKELLARVDSWHARHNCCAPNVIGVCRPLLPPKDCE